MGWTYEQQNRLQKEIDILNQFFPAFTFTNVGTNVCVEGWMTTNKKNNYKIRLYIPSDLPYSVPDVVITSPYPVKGYLSKNLLDYGTSATMHLLSPRDGYPKICHYRSVNWNANVTFYKVLMKVRIWLEALDGHISTGNSLEYYLTHQA
jgi:hypothetical protein